MSLLERATKFLKPSYDTATQGHVAMRQLEAAVNPPSLGSVVLPETHLYVKYYAGLNVRDNINTPWTRQDAFRHIQRKGLQFCESRLPSQVLAMVPRDTVFFELVERRPGKKFGIATNSDRIASEMYVVGSRVEGDGEGLLTTATGVKIQLEGRNLIVKPAQPYTPSEAEWLRMNLG